MSKFQQRHYITVAQCMQGALKETSSPEHRHGVWLAIANMADMFKRDNGQFRRELFIAACTPGANVNARTVEGALKEVNA